MPRRLGAGWYALVTFVIACGATPAADAPRVSRSAAPATSCARVQERLDALERAGRVERLYAATTTAREECPALAVRARALRAAAAAALGVCEEAGGQPCSPAGDGEDALAKAIAAQDTGDPAAARRLFDRAARAFAANRTPPLSVETTTSPNTSMYPRASFSPDGRWAVGAVGHRLTIIDTAARRRVLSFACQDGANAAFGEGFVAVIGCDGAPGEERAVRDHRERVLVFALPSTRPIATAVPHASAMAVGGTLVATADGGTITVLDGTKGTTSWKAEIPVAPNAAIGALAFDPKTTRLAARETTGAITILAAADGRVLRKLAARRSFASAPVFSPDGELLADVGADAPSVLWSVTTGAARAIPNVKASNVTFARDGRQAIVWGGDRVGTLDVSSGKVLRERATVGVSSLVETKRGWLALEQDESGGFTRVDLASGARRPGFSGTAEGGRVTVGAALAPDGTRWAYVDGAEYFEGNPIHLGSEAATEATYPSHVEARELRAPALSEDAALIALSRRDSVVLVELPSGHIARRWPAKDAVALAFSPSHDALAIVVDQGVDVVETRDGSVRFRLPDIYRPLVAWGRDVLAVTESSAGPIRIVDGATGRTLSTVPLPPTQTASRLGFDRDGALLVETYGSTFAIHHDAPNPTWSTREAKEGLLLARCPRESTQLPAWLRRDHRELAAISGDCRVGVMMRDREVSLRRLPQGERAVLLEAVHGRDEFFFRAATTVRTANDDGTLVLADGTKRPGYLRAGDAVPRDVLQLVGPRARALVTCRLGPRVLPPEVCDERAFDPELVERFLADARE